MYRETRSAGTCSKTNLFSSQNTRDTALKTQHSRRSWRAPRPLPRRPALAAGPAGTPSPPAPPVPPSTRTADDPAGTGPSATFRPLTPCPRLALGADTPIPPTPLLSLRSAHHCLDADPRPRRQACAGSRAHGVPSWRQPRSRGRGARGNSGMSGGLARPRPRPRGPAPQDPDRAPGPAYLPVKDPEPAQLLQADRARGLPAVAAPRVVGRLVHVPGLHHGRARGQRRRLTTDLLGPV